MSYLEEQEWMILNEINYNISSISDIQELYHNIFDWLGLLINYDCGMFSAIRKEKESYKVPYELKIVETRNIPQKYTKAWESEIARSDTTKLLIYNGRDKAYKVSDFISDEKKKETGLYKQFYEPLELFYNMGMCIVFDDEPLGMIQMYRRKEQQDFTDRDIFILNQLRKHLGYRISYEVRKGNINYYYAEAYQEKLYEKYDLTEKERLIFDYAVEGLTNAEISEELNLSIHTVRKHFYNLYSKMKVTNRIQLLQGTRKSDNT